MRYLAWAASRALPMQRLEVKWGTRFGTLLAAPPQVESPPEDLLDAAERTRPVRLMHPTLGEITVVLIIGSERILVHDDKYPIWRRPWMRHRVQVTP
jgi:hypothetical protein